MNPKINIFKNTDDIAEAIALLLKKLSVESNGKAIHIALSGGSSPISVFNYLTKTYGTQLAHPLLHFWWGDDRCVAPEDDDSNYKWANQLWLSPMNISANRIHRVLGENDPTKEAIRYSKEIKEHVAYENGWPCFDFILLGLGEDGHTASIFPSQMELLNSDKLCEVATHPVSGQQRITFTGHLINNAKKVYFLATGEKKAQKVAEIINEKRKDLPASHIEPKGQLRWLLDPSAAQLLK
jgi:6-phosphogluconolactonase